jgi:hypothetical protein
MEPEYEQLAAAVTAAVAPFTPYLIDSAKAVGQSFLTVIAEKGGEAAWERAKELWRRIQERYRNTPSVRAASSALAISPDDRESQQFFAKKLLDQLQADRECAAELLQILGGQGALQRILIDHGGYGESILQELRGGGSQTVQIRENATGKNITQRIIRD